MSTAAAKGGRKRRGVGVSRATLGGGQLPAPRRRADSLACGTRASTKKRCLYESPWKRPPSPCRVRGRGAVGTATEPRHARDWARPRTATLPRSDRAGAGARASTRRSSAALARLRAAPASSASPRPAPWPGTARASTACRRRIFRGRHASASIQAKGQWRSFLSFLAAQNGVRRQRRPRSGRRERAGAAPDRGNTRRGARGEEEGEQALPGCPRSTWRT
jgi:hypothetical protein